MTNFIALSAPFPPDEIEWRVGATNKDKSKGLALAYLTARHVMDRLDEVCGPGNWQDSYEFHGNRTICTLSIRIGDEWVSKSDGAGDTDVEAEKGSISDALKRAAVKWGIGRYLYGLTNVWVDIQAAGRSYRIADGQEQKLARALLSLTGEVPSERKKPTPTNPAKPKSKDWGWERDELTRNIQACQNLDDFAEMWSTQRFQNFVTKAPKEYSNAVIRIKDQHKQALEQLGEPA